MQITMLNGEKSPKYESKFTTAVALYYPQCGTTKYTMSASDVSEIIVNDMNERLFRNHGRTTDTSFNF